MSDASNITSAYTHIHPEALAAATREAIARLELDDHTVRMQAIIANSPDAQLASGETITAALARIAEAKSRLEETYSHLLNTIEEEAE